MTVRPRRGGVRVLLVMLGALALNVGAPVPVGAGVDDPPAPPTSLDNDFIPQRRDLSDCVSALPRPDCGSESRGGWRQGLVLALVVAGVAIVGWRVVSGVRRRDADTDADAGGDDVDRHDVASNPDVTRRD